ncbi:MAG: hypothetical protein WCI38_00165, partial [Chthoniobacterales bacterium]
LCLPLLFFSMTARSAVVSTSAGSVTILKNNIQSTGAENLGGVLPTGTILTTGGDGKVLVEVAPGITIELQPETQITIGETIPDRGQDAGGNPIPETYVTLAVGSITCDTSGAATGEGGAMTTSLVVMTPRGTVSPASAGSMVISSTHADPRLSTVTVAARSGDKMVNTTGDQQVIIPEGLVGVFRPDGFDLDSI